MSNAISADESLGGGNNLCPLIARSAIRELQAMQDELLSGDDSGLTNVWEEICAQVQGEPSAYWVLYDDVAHSIVERLVLALPPSERLSIWEHLTACVDRELPTEPPASPIAVAEITEFIQRNYVYRIASAWADSAMDGLAVD